MTRYKVYELLLSCHHRSVVDSCGTRWRASRARAPRATAVAKWQDPACDRWRALYDEPSCARDFDYTSCTRMLVLIQHSTGVAMLICRRARPSLRVSTAWRPKPRQGLWCGPAALGTAWHSLLLRQHSQSVRSPVVEQLGRVSAASTQCRLEPVTGPARFHFAHGHQEQPCKAARKLVGGTGSASRRGL